MKVFKNIVLFSLIVLLILGISTSAGAKITAKLGSLVALQNPQNIATEKFIELVKEQTDGEIEIENFPISQLGGGLEEVQSVSMGAVQFFVGGIGWESSLVNEYLIFNLPFVFSREDVRLIAEGPIGEKLNNELIKNHGIRIVASNWMRPPRHVFTKEPVLNIQDLKNLKLRIPETQSYILLWGKAGANPTPIAWGELYLALQQGVVDGFENLLSSVYDYKLYEVVDHCLLTSHMPEPVAVIVNEKWWQGLKPDYREIISKAAYEAGELFNTLVSEQEDGYKQKLENEGILFHEADQTEFIKAVFGVAEELEASGNWRKGFYNECIEYLNSIK